MKTVEIHCRKFEEWDEPTQKKILDKHRDINVEYNDWYDCEFEFWKEKLNGLGFEEVEIAFSGFWSQGDGASFTGKVNIIKWIEVNNPTKFKRLYNLLKSGSLYVYDNTLKKDRWYNYVHWNTTSLYLHIYENDNIDRPNIRNLIDQLYDDVLSHHQQLNKEIYRDLENSYDDQVSDEAVEETLRINEYEFDENGKIW